MHENSIIRIAGSARLLSYACPVQTGQLTQLISHWAAGHTWT
jgi:hypothetical protein